MLGITDLHSDIILSNLNVSSRVFTFDFSKKTRTNRNIFITHKFIINFLISERVIHLPSILNIA